MRIRPALVGLGALTLVAAGAAVVLARSDDGRDAARAAAWAYLDVLSDDGRDPAALDDLVDLGADADWLPAADAALASATDRIGDVDLGEPTETSVARGTADGIYERFLQFPVTYTLAGAEHEAVVAVGEPRSDPEHWRVVTPLTGSVRWGSADADGVFLDVSVAGASVTEPGREADDAPAQVLHPGVYPARAGLGSWLDSDPVDVAVVAGADDVPPPDFDLRLTDAGRAQVTRSALAAFEPCRTGTAYCPVTGLVHPGARDDWWGGLTSEPSVAVEDHTVTLTGGAFRYRSPRGVRTVAFVATGRYRIDLTTRRPVVARPLEVERASVAF